MQIFRPPQSNTYPTRKSTTIQCNPTQNMNGSPGIEQSTEWSSVLKFEMSILQPLGHKGATRSSSNPTHLSTQKSLHTQPSLSTIRRHPNYLIRNLFGGAAGSVISMKMGVTFETHLLPCGTANYLTDIEPLHSAQPATC